MFAQYVLRNVKCVRACKGFKRSMCALLKTHSPWRMFYCTLYQSLPSFFEHDGLAFPVILDPSGLVHCQQPRTRGEKFHIIYMKFGLQWRVYLIFILIWLEEHAPKYSGFCLDKNEENAHGGVLHWYSWPGSCESETFVANLRSRSSKQYQVMMSLWVCTNCLPLITST